MLDAGGRVASRGGRACAIGASMVEQGGYSHMNGLTGGRLIWTSFGVGGERTDQINARLSSVTALSPRICIYDGGMNDVIQDIATATIEANIDAAIATLHAAGIEPVLATMQPFKNYNGWTSGRESKRQALNAYCRATGLRLVDYDLTHGDGAASPAVVAQYDSGDGLHVNNAGDLAISRGVFTQLFGGVPV